jgi:hypothetical protein
MNVYRCVFLDNHSEAIAIEPMDVADLDQAIDLAIEMLKARPHYRAIEVWRGGQRLYASEPKGWSETGDRA